MDDTTPTPAKPRRRLGAAGLLAAGLLTGGIIAGSQIANAAGSSSGTAATSTASSNGTNGSTGTRNAPPRMDPAKVSHGPGETLLTGDTAAKVKAAALKQVPGATVVRVETDSGGAAYEAHLQKADGSYVTVRFDKQFKVTDTQDGFGCGGPGGGHPPGAPNGTSDSTN
jgi:hypothetical protein